MDAQPTDSATALLTSNSAASKDSQSKSTPTTSSSTENNNAPVTNESVVTSEKQSASPSSPPVTPALAPAPESAATAPPKPSTPVVAPKAAPPKAPASVPTKQAVKKKRKRTGIAAFFLALGCLSEEEFEDKPSSKASAVKQTTPVVQQKPTAHKTEATSTTVGEPSTLNEKAQSEALVVSPGEPVSPSFDETAGVTSSAVQPPGSGSELLHPHIQRRESEGLLAGTHAADAQKTDTSGGYTDLTDEGIDDAGSSDNQELVYGEDDYEDDEDKLIAQGGIGIPFDDQGNPAPLLPLLSQQDEGRKCLVLDLDETLLHSSFKMLASADYIVPVEIESQTHNVYVIKRPGVDHFLQEMGKIYEVVVFTASLSKYADPVLDMLDVNNVVRHRLFRESCYNHKGNYVKDLSQLGRDMSTCIIIDNSPASYIFHPNNAVPVSTWFNDPHDTELTDLCPFLADLATVDDVRGVLDGSI